MTQRKKSINYSTKKDMINFPIYQFNYYFIMKKLSFAVLAFFVLTMTGCDLFDKEDDPKPSSSFDNSEMEGNLVISNFSNTAIALYHNGECLRKIPNSSTDFLIWLPNPSDMTFDLQIYKYDDVAPDFDPNPDGSIVFKRWNINLSNSKDIEKRVTWHILESSEETNSGTLIFNYVGGTDNQVDIFLNSRNGAKIITLKPGDQYDNIVGIDYGAYTMHFRYWYSDPNTPGSLDVIGWIETEMVSGFEVDIYAVLNANRPSFDIWIPHWEEANVIPDTRGSIEITNQYYAPIIIYANGQLIENIIYLDENTQATSILPNADVQTFIVEGDKQYLMAAEPLNASNTLTDVSFELPVGKLVKWKILMDEEGNAISEVILP
jgi:hypothetical protein